MLLKKYLNKDIVLINQKTINKEIKERYGINRLLSFSRVAFNENYTKAAIGVVNFGGKLDSSFTIYILEKNENKWQIKYYQIVVYS